MTNPLPIKSLGPLGMAGTPAYEQTWGQAPAQVRWMLTVPTNVSDPGLPVPLGLPTPSRDMLSPRIGQFLSPQATVLMDRAFGCLGMDRVPQWPAVVEGSTAASWQWADPVVGPVLFARMLVEVLDFSIKGTQQGPDQAKQERLHRALGQLLDGQVPGWTPAMFGVFFPTETWSQLVKDSRSMLEATPLVI